MFYKCQIDYVLEWRATRTALKYGLTFSDKKESGFDSSPYISNVRCICKVHGKFQSSFEFSFEKVVDFLVRLERQILFPRIVEHKLIRSLKLTKQKLEF